MSDLIFTNIYIFALAVVLAVLEIQIEGPNGWAKNLPTWRPHPQKWYSQIYSKIMSGREFTGYHLTMFIFVFMIFHLPYVFGLEVTLDHWLKTISYYLMFSVMWDFLWFVLNPHYPLKNFTKEYISWHKRWLGYAPVDYYSVPMMSLLVILPLIILQKSTEPFIWWGLNFSLFVLQTALLILFTLYILKIDNWKK